MCPVKVLETCSCLDDKTNQVLTIDNPHNTTNVKNMHLHIVNNQEGPLGRTLLKFRRIFRIFDR